MEQPIRTGFIGLGAMGAGMAANLLRANVSLVVFDPNPTAVAKLTASGAESAATAAEVASRVERLFLCLPFAPEVREVLFADNGVIHGMHKNLHIVDCTTLVHSDALAIAQQSTEHGLLYNDCPISGGPGRAADGSLSIMFGGEQAQFDSVRVLLGHMGEDIIHCGALGSGQLMKAINNVIYDINIAALCELLPLAIKAGLDANTVASIVTSASSRSFASDMFVPKIMDRKFEGDFPMQSAWKDIVNVQEIAVRYGAMTPVTNAMTAVYQSAMAQGHGAEPKSAMIKIYEKVLGVEVQRS
ncbi:MAG: 3-hydroxyisobutyrate dehydrogenase-like beta-hydroxyacid dehydrogenase [Gammaproteobacteria bacterium]